MQAAIELLKRLEDDINALTALISEMDSPALFAFKKGLSKKLPSGSASSVALILVYREIRRRRCL